MRTTEASVASSATTFAGTGKGVKVAVIDSGVNAQHSHVQRVTGGVQVYRRENGTLSFGEDWRDSLGHGTAIAGVLRAKAPGAELYSVKVFDRALHTHAEIVAAAIRWAADQKMNVANCSLSTENAEHRILLEEACNYATARGVLLVASCDDRAQELFPACLPQVIAVAGDERCAWDEYYWEEGTGVFRAHPHPRPLPRLPQRLNLQGHSFAAAHIAARIACLREQYPAAGREQIVEMLVANAAPPPTVSEASEKE
jgi:Subtilase family